MEGQRAAGERPNSGVVDRRPALCPPNDAGTTLCEDGRQEAVRNVVERAAHRLRSSEQQVYEAQGRFEKVRESDEGSERVVRSPAAAGPAPGPRRHLTELGAQRLKANLRLIIADEE
jgi:hypothetical protein